MNNILKLLKKILLWLLVSFFAMASITYLPGIAGICAVLVVVLLIPISKWQEIIQKIISGKIKVIIVIVFIILTFITAPVEDSTPSNADTVNDTAITETGAQIAEPTTESTTKPTTEPTTEPTTKPTTEPTTQPTTKPISETISVPTVIPENSEPERRNDWELITCEGHPRIWDREETSYNVWDDIEKGKIRLPDSNSKYQDTNIVYMESMKDNNGNRVICDIQVYLQNFTDPSNYGLDEVLPIINSYLPVSMADNYEVANSYIAVPKDAEKETHYFIQYYPTDEAKESGNTFYGVAVEIQVDNGVVQLFRLSLNFPKWANFLERNGYIKEEWEFDFLAE